MEKNKFKDSPNFISWSDFVLWSLKFLTSYTSSLNKFDVSDIWPRKSNEYNDLCGNLMPETKMSYELLVTKIELLITNN